MLICRRCVNNTSKVLKNEPCEACTYTILFYFVKVKNLKNKWKSPWHPGRISKKSVTFNVNAFSSFYLGILQYLISHCPNGTVTHFQTICKSLRRNPSSQGSRKSSCFLRFGRSPSIVTGVVDLGLVHDPSFLLAYNDPLLESCVSFPLMQFVYR